MKKLNKLEINPEKIMKNEELISLRGGSNCTCYTEPNQQGSTCMTGAAGSYEECKAMCDAAGCASASFQPY